MPLTLKKGAGLKFWISLYGNRLNPSGGKAFSHLSPQNRRQLESDDTVQNPSCLLGVDKVLVHVSRVLNGIQYGVFCNFVEHNSLRVLRLESQIVLEVPGYGFSLAVFIGCQIDGVCLCGQSLKVCNHLFLVCRNLIFGLEPVFYVYAQGSLRQITYMSET